MAEGHTDSSGKFHPHSNDSKDKISSDQAVSETEEPTVNASDAEKLKDSKEQKS